MRFLCETRQLTGPQTASAVRRPLAPMMPIARKEQPAAVGSVPADAARRAIAAFCGCLSVLVVSSQPALADSCPTFNTVSKGEAKGLQWCDVKVGDGESPVPKAFIKAHYTGALDSEMASGVFDSSYDRRKPLGFMVGTHQVISGWDLGILGDGDELPPMKAHGIRKLVLPPNLAYGERGAGGVIPPNATLYFDIEFLGGIGKK